LLFSFLLLSLVPLFGSNGIGYLRSRQIVETQVMRYLHAIVELQAGHVAEHVQQQLAYLGAVATGNRFLQAAAERDLPGAEPTMRAAATPAAVSRYLRRQIEEAGRFEDMALLSLDGRLISSATGQRTLYPSAGPASDPVTVIREDDGASPPTLRFTAPVTSQSGEVVAYLSAWLPAAEAPAFLEFPAHVAGMIELLLLDRAGRPVFVSHPHAGLRYDRTMANPLLDLPPGTSRRYVNAEGVDVIGTSVTLPGSFWLFIAEAPASTALGDLSALRRLSLLLGGVFALLVLGVGWWMASGIVAPVHELVDATEKVAGGDLGTRVPVLGHDEIGELSESFNKMAADLADNERRIRELHDLEIERAGQLATVGELASGLAHEIKNPVVGISNGMDLVLRRVGSDPKLEPIATEMKRQLERIEQAVRDLLALARPRAPEPAPTDVNDVVKRALTLVDPAADSAGVTIDAELAASLPELQLDAELLRQALVNLVVNAVQHSKSGDTVTVTTRRGGDAVEIEVRDTGPGIAPETREQLFKPFFTTRHSGTGLGLSITRGIVERHGGALRVVSDVGHGAAFTIVLPNAPAGSVPGTER